MYIDPHTIKGTKILVNRKDVNAVQKVLFNNGYGYELNLAKDTNLRKYKKDVCFYVDYNGYITVEEKQSIADDDFWDAFYSSTNEEIDWSVLF